MTEEAFELRKKLKKVFEQHPMLSEIGWDIYDDKVELIFAWRHNGEVEPSQLNEELEGYSRKVWEEVSNTDFPLPWCGTLDREEVLDGTPELS